MSPKLRLIVVAVDELTPADTEVIRGMDVCPACGTEPKNGAVWHTMCYRCYGALPPGVRKPVDGLPAGAVLKMFLIYMKVLSRTHVLLTRRGETASSAAATPARVEPVPPAPQPRPRPGSAAPSRRGQATVVSPAWETIWHED